MDTVKVDLEKLQLLNDRIAQAIEALNQVRMSTHGLQHSATWNTPQGPTFGQPFAQQPFGTQQVGPFGPGIWGQTVPQFGLQHTYTHQPPMMPFSNYGTYGQSVPFANQLAGLGISHTTPQAAQLGQVGRAAMVDPTWTQRVAHTFPFVTSPFPPTIG